MRLKIVCVLRYLSVELHSLSVEHLPAVLRWRNRDSVRLLMKHADPIDEHAHKRWFESLCPTKDHYFVLSYQNCLGGLLNVSAIDSEKKTAQVGIFLGEPSWYGTCIPWFASHTLLTFAFQTLRLSAVFAHVRRSNTRVLCYNASLGFCFYQNLDPFFSEYKNTPSQWRRKIQPIESLLNRLSKKYPYEVLGLEEPAVLLFS